ncbi:unnamed protein product [Nyctereutes procyonoides]|uniref:(raccoon dog) hypothetical protein n=1 Tax=Nyctereutes procyonoides TaxID=34880 RepID=A0A811XX61_NYCPR|nr:unnamed protein product [Nyctereutes procyonoides]
MLAAPCPRGCALPPREARLTLGLPEGRKQTLCGARRATPTPRGAGRRRPGASSRPARPEGAGPGGHLLPAPTPTLRNATWPPKRSGGNLGSGESARGQEVARCSSPRAFPERLLCAPRRRRGPVQRGEVPQKLTFVGPLPAPHLPPAVRWFPSHQEETEARSARGFHCSFRWKTADNYMLPHQELTSCRNSGTSVQQAGCCNGVGLCTLT